MKKFIISLIFLIFTQILIITPATASSVYNFSPNPSDFNDLDHYRYYLWGIDWNIPDNETIIGASFFIDDINNWTVEANDQLFIGLLNEAPLGVTSYPDGQGTSNSVELYALNNSIDYWHLDTYTDTQDFPGPAEDYYYTFTGADLAQLTSFLANGSFGLGLDADCHYWNNGARFRIETSPAVPEPSTLALTFFSMLSGFGIRKKQRC